MLTALFDTSAERISDLSASIEGQEVYATTSFEDFLSVPELRLVVECANGVAARAYSERVLNSDRDLLVMSSGALTDSILFERLSGAATERNRRLLVPSGALGGIDAIRAVRHLLEEVKLTTTKSPRSLSGAPGFQAWEGQLVATPCVVFDGPALEAVKLFPANVNVAATLSLAGLGPQRTRVTVVADPTVVRNIHEVEARGEFGVLRFRMELLPHPENPRTSALAIYSALETLRSACSTGPRIGT